MYRSFSLAASWSYRRLQHTSTACGNREPAFVEACFEDISCYRQFSTIFSFFAYFSSRKIHATCSFPRSFIEDISCYLQLSSIFFYQPDEVRGFFSYMGNFLEKSKPRLIDDRGKLPHTRNILETKNLVEDNCLLREISSTKKRRSRIFPYRSIFPRSPSVRASFNVDTLAL